MALSAYLAEETALDHADGLISRRDALRRLALLGLGATAAAALLAACGSDGSTATAASTTVGPTSTGGPTTGGPTPAAGGPTSGEVAARIARTTPHTFVGPAGILQAALARAEGEEKGVVLVIHENKGLTDHIRSVAGRLAGDGYTALALDLLSRKGGTAAAGDPTAALGQLPTADLVADMQAAVVQLDVLAPKVACGAMGFCFGGGMVWQLLDAGSPTLAAAVPFYGPSPDAPTFDGDRAAVLGIFAGLDNRVNAGKDKLEAALTAAELTHELRVLPNVNHAFFNDTGASYDAGAAATAYAGVLDWFGTHLR